MLGERLSSFGRDAHSQEVIRRAMAENEWFTERDVRQAIDAICRRMLHRADIEQWLSRYNVPMRVPKRVAVIMAGNIPAVGFFDMMCVLAAGGVPQVKYSSKDRVLVEYIVNLLREIEPEIRVEEYVAGESCPDAVIATGSDSSNIYFRSAFGSLPHILRGSRHSVAVLSGEETATDLAALSDDIFSYSGLGCRSVSLVFVPEKVDVRIPSRPMCRAYHNNYLQTRALMTMAGEAFEDTGEAIFAEVQSAEFPKRLSRVNVCRYRSIDDVRAWLTANDTRLQCVVSQLDVHPRVVPLGMAQYPALDDYADDVDVMAFLQSLS